MTISSLSPKSFMSATGSDPMTAAAGGPMGKDQFIKLLIAQMTHQDPLNPTDGQQMATQLAQFSSVEQLINMNAKLDGQSTSSSTLIDAINRSAAVGLLGKTVTVQSNLIEVGAASTPTVAAQVNNAGGQLTVRITDANGVTLRSADFGNVTGGMHNVSIENLTTGLPNGTYKVAFDVTDGSGAVTHPTSLVTAKIDGIQYGANGAMLTSGARLFPIGSIVSVNSSTN